MAIVNSEDMKERVFQELKKQYKEKFKDDSMFKDFFNRYILETINDSDLLVELNKKGRDLTKFEPIDFLENESILIRTIRVCVLLELSKDYTAFRKLNKKIYQDKYPTYELEFEKLLTALMKIQPESPN